MTKFITMPVAFITLVRGFVTGIAFRLLELAGQLMPPNAWGCRIRGLIYKPFMKRCGRNFQVGLQAKLEHLHNIDVGNDVYIGHGCWISGLRGGLVFEDQVMLGPYVCMVSSNHRFENGSARFPTGIGAPIRIGYGTWIASGATITAGVNVGRSCLIAAGCVVTRDVEDETIVGGVPSKVIGKINAEDKSNPASSGVVKVSQPTRH